MVQTMFYLSNALNKDAEVVFPACVLHRTSATIMAGNLEVCWDSANMMQAL